MLMVGLAFLEEIVAIRGLGIQLTTTKGLQITIPTIPSLSPFVNHPTNSDSPSPSPKSVPRPDSAPTAALTLTVKVSASVSFIPLSSIGDVIINEAVYGWGIIYYLAILTWSPAQGGAQGEPSDAKLVIGFPELLPRLALVREVWQGVRATLFDELDPNNTSDDDHFDQDG